MDVASLVAPLLFVAHGLNCLQFDLFTPFLGEWKSKSPYPWKLVYLTVQCNFLHLLFGLAWAVEILCPGVTHGTVYFSTPLVCGCGLYVFFNYYALIHFHVENANFIKDSADRGELLYSGRGISPAFFFKIMNWVHAPLLPLDLLPLVAMDRAQLVASTLSLASTCICVVVFFVWYASLVIFVRWISGYWVYPFMDDFTRAWHHALFYSTACGIYAVFCMGYRFLIFATTGQDVPLSVCSCIVFVATVVGLLLSTGGKVEARESRTAYADYHPLDHDKVTDICVVSCV